MTIGKETFVMSGFIGGVGWGGMAADRKGVIYANSSTLPGISSIVESKSLLTSGVGEGAYRTQCAACHGADRKGIPDAVPAVDNLKGRLTDAEIASVIKDGRGRMPGFPGLPAPTVANLVAFLTTGEDLPGTARPQISLQGRFQPSQTLYTSTGNRNFVDAEGYPGVKPPWGTLNAIDMNTGQYLWRIPFGTTGAMGPQYGGSNTGGAVVTASGLLFIGATADRKFHAFDAKTGKLLWETTLSAPAQSTPATYMVGGRQYVVVASAARRAGGNQARAQDNAQALTQGQAPGGYVAFALPRK
jgi:quinoprotein glucose dehydrogenase